MNIYRMGSLSNAELDYPPEQGILPQAEIDIIIIIITMGASSTLSWVCLHYGMNSS
jgi:hypothetical protein